MKKIYIALVFVLAIVFLFSACKKKDAYSEAKELLEVNNQSESAASTFKEAPDYTYGYEKVLDRKNYVLCEYFPDMYEESGEIGIMECAMYNGDYAKNYIGYVIKDVNSDGVYELLICEGDMIYAMYTMVNGNPTLLFTGWSRNRWYLLDDGTLYNTGSSGASESSHGIYAISNGKLECQKYYFMTDIGLGNVAYFYNTTGSYQITESTKISEATYFNESSLAESRMVYLNDIPFSYYKAGNDDFHIFYEHQFGDIFTDYTELAFKEESQYSTGIFFLANEPISNFKLLSLTYVENGYNWTYNTEEVATLDSVAEGEVILINAELMDSVVFGISYTDSDGVEKRYAVDESGIDSALFFVTF